MPRRIFGTRNTDTDPILSIASHNLSKGEPGRTKKDRNEAALANSDYRVAQVRLFDRLLATNAVRLQCLLLDFVG